MGVPPGQGMLGPKGPEWGEQLAGPKSPFVAVLLNFICCFPLGHLYLGQTKKAMFYFLFSLVASMVAIGPLAVWVIAMIDAYQLAERMNQQGSVRAMENGIDFLDEVYGPKGIIKT